MVEMVSKGVSADFFSNTPILFIRCQSDCLNGVSQLVCIENWKGGRFGNTRFVGHPRRAPFLVPIVAFLSSGTLSSIPSVNANLTRTIAQLSTQIHRIARIRGQLAEVWNFPIFVCGGLNAVGSNRITPDLMRRC